MDAQHLMYIWCISKTKVRQTKDGMGFPSSNKQNVLFVATGKTHTILGLSDLGFWYGDLFH